MRSFFYLYLVLCVAFVLYLGAHQLQSTSNTSVEPLQDTVTVLLKTSALELHTKMNHDIITSVEIVHQHSDTGSSSEMSTVDSKQSREIAAVNYFLPERNLQSWEKKLYTPTYIISLFSVWIIVDCWHHRVLYHHTLADAIEKWTDLDLAASGPSPPHRPLRIPHSVATDGELLVVESSVGGSNGQNHSVLVYQYVHQGGESKFQFVSEVVCCERKEVRRPHRVSYDRATNAFYVYLTSPPHMAKLIRQGNKLVVEYCLSLPFMKGAYARSFAFHDRRLYITAGPGVIWQADYGAGIASPGAAKGSIIRPVKAYSIRPLGFMKQKMNDIQFIDGWWYATCTVPCAFVRFRNFSSMGRSENLAKKLGLCERINRSVERCHTGTPYFITKVGQHYYVPYIFGCSGIVRFQVEGPGNSEIANIEHLFKDGWVERKDDLEQRGTQW